MGISGKIVIQIGAAVLLLVGSAAHACEIYVVIGGKKVCQQRVQDATFLLDEKDARTLQRLESKSNQNKQKANSFAPNAPKTGF